MAHNSENSKPDKFVFAVQFVDLVFAKPDPHLAY